MVLRRSGWGVVEERRDGLCRFDEGLIGLMIVLVY